MKLCVAYIAVCNGPLTTDYCARFVTTWHEYPPLVETDLTVICNGGPLTVEQSLLFSSLEARMFVRSNNGWDIAGYQEASRAVCANYDAVLWTGESNYFHREGWLLRLAEAWTKHGPGFYGPYSSNAVRAHLNTTAFFCAPGLVKSYPKYVASRQDRYEFEHGEWALWRRAQQQQLQTQLVTWDGEWDPFRWRMPRDILWRGDQSNCLMWCNHADGYANANRDTQGQWARRADAPYR